MYQDTDGKAAPPSATTVFGTPPRGMGAQEQPRPTPPGERRLVDPSEMSEPIRAPKADGGAKLVDAQFEVGERLRLRLQYD